MGDKKEETVVATVEPELVEVKETVPADNSIDTFISQAIAEKAPIETIKEFLAIRKELKADQAKEDYVVAMSVLQGQIPTIKKLKANGGTQSKYAPLEDIVSQTRKVISDNKFSYNWDTVTAEGSITVICKVTHANGHIETSTMVSKIAEGTRANSEPQKAAITITYLKRYTLCNIFGIVVADEDQDDRIKQMAPKLPANPKAKIVALMRMLGHSDVATMPEKVKELTQLDPNEVGNVDEIISRLTLTHQEQNESN